MRRFTQDALARRASQALLPLVLFAGANAAGAAVITQFEDFDFSAGPVSGSGSLDVVANETDFSATFSPFNSSLGTLESFTVIWEADFTGSGTVSGANGSIDGNFGGAFSLAGSGYNGTGNSGGDNGTDGESVAIELSIEVSDTFLPADAGASYDPAILAAVTGDTDFDVAWDTTYSIDYTNIADLLGAATGGSR